MNDTLATEAASTPLGTPEETPATEAVATPPPQRAQPVRPPLADLETPGGTAVMRHVPSIDWMITKIESTLHGRVELALSAIQKSTPEDATRERIEAQLRLAARAFEHLSDATRKHPAHHHEPADPVGHLRSALVAAVAALRSVDPQTFGRREPYHHFERSKTELIYAAVLRAMVEVDQLIDVVRPLDSTIDEKLFGHLVKLSQPLNDEVKRPIA